MFEPYLNYTHHLDRFFDGLVHGINLGDAAYSALPVLSWQAVIVGDPLCRTLQVSLDEQFGQLAQGSPGLGQYAAIRKMHHLRLAGDMEDASELGERGLRMAPGIALRLALGHVYLVCRGIRSAVEVLGFIPRVKILPSDDWIPALEAAEILAALDELQPALSIYRKLIDSRGIPDELLPRLLSDGSRLAWAAGRSRWPWTGRIARVNRI